MLDGKFEFALHPLQYGCQSNLDAAVLSQGGSGDDGS